MNNLVPITLNCRIGETTVEVCHGDIPDIFRQLRYDPVTEFELPDAKRSNEEFNDFINIYRYYYLGGYRECQILEESQWN